MKILRFTLALVITIGMLYIARTNSRGKPEFITHTENGYTFEYTANAKTFENETIVLSLKIIGPFNEKIKPILRSLKKTQDISTNLRKYGSIRLKPDDSLENVFYAELQAGRKGGKQLYFFEIRDNVGGRLASLMAPSGKPFAMKFIGKVPTIVLVLHIFCMFATVFLITLGAIKGIELIQGKIETKSFINTYALATIFAFLGGYPFGFMMNHYAFGTIWEGVPFGTDATDNKTQIMFIYFLFIVLAGLGSLTNKKFGKDIFSPKILGWLGLFGFILMLGIYLIPHSIQFDPFFTKVVCWGWIALIVLVYITALYRVIKKDSK